MAAGKNRGPHCNRRRDRYNTTGTGPAPCRLREERPAPAKTGPGCGRFTMSEKVTIKVERQTHHLPAIALRGLVVFPNNLVHFEVGREKSVAAIEWAMSNNSNVFLVAQKKMGHRRARPGRSVHLRRGGRDQAGASRLGRPGPGLVEGKVPRQDDRPGRRRQVPSGGGCSPRRSAAPKRRTLCRPTRWSAPSRASLTTIWPSTSGWPRTWSLPSSRTTTRSFERVHPGQPPVPL